MREICTRTLAPLLTMALVLGTGGGLLGCSDDDENGTNPVDTPFPGAPPRAASLQIDLGDLGSDGRPQLSGPCHASSAFLVTVANALVVVTLATPVAVLGVTVQAEPVFVGNQTWRWTASGGTGAEAWSSELEGRVLDPTTLGWTMRVSGTRLGLDRFLWYTGTSDLAAATGTWSFYDPLDPDEVDDTMRSTYQLVSETSGTLSFEDRNDDGAGFGNELLYEAADDDLAVSLHVAAEGATFSVEWSRSTGAGRQTNLAGETCCWGPRPSFDDVPCR